MATKSIMVPLGILKEVNYYQSKSIFFEIYILIDIFKRERETTTIKKKTEPCFP